MIRITQIDEKLSIFKDNTVILWGANKHCEKMIDLFNYHNVKVFAICDFDSNKSGEKIKGIEIISLSQLKDLSHKGHSLVIQEIPWFDEWERVKFQTQELNVKSYIMIRETWHILLFKQRYDLYKANPKFVIADKDIDETIVKMRREELRQYVENSFGESVNIICTPCKVGDHTLIETFNKYNIPFIQLWRTPNAFDENIFKNTNNKVRIFVGLRDPIAQNLSWVYQLLARSVIDEQELLNELICNHEYLFRECGNAQYFFDIWLKNLNYLNVSKIEKPILHHIQGILNQFQTEICDFTKYPFNKEKGYTIIKEDNKEIFIFQLEKLNYLVAEISSFLETNIEDLVVTNKASDKWIDESYKRAQKELKFSIEYYEKCLNEDFVKHCYCDDDINQMRSKWFPNIIK